EDPVEDAFDRRPHDLELLACEFAPDSERDLIQELFNFLASGVKETRDDESQDELENSQPDARGGTEEEVLYGTDERAQILAELFGIGCGGNPPFGGSLADHRQPGEPTRRLAQSAGEHALHPIDELRHLRSETDGQSANRHQKDCQQKERGERRREFAPSANELQDSLVKTAGRNGDDRAPEECSEKRPDDQVTADQKQDQHSAQHVALVACTFWSFGHRTSSPPAFGADGIAAPGWGS